MVNLRELIDQPRRNYALGKRVSVSKQIAAPAAKIFDLLADPARHADIDGSGTVVAARSPGRRLAKGDVFGMDMKMGAPYAMRNVVIEFEENRRIAWQAGPTGPAAKLVGGRIWRYELEPVGEQTVVTETWDITEEAVPSTFLIRLTMPSVAQRSMERTLARIEQLVTSGA